MQIKHEAAADPDSPVGTTALIHEEFTQNDDGEVERVEFNDDGVARVKKEIGEQLCENYEDIVPVSDGADEGDDSSDTETDTDTEED